MRKEFIDLRNDIAALYPDQQFTDDELNEMTHRLIRLAVIMTKELQRQRHESKPDSISEPGDSTSEKA